MPPYLSQDYQVGWARIENTRGWGGVTTEGGGFGGGRNEAWGARASPTLEYFLYECPLPRNPGYASDTYIRCRYIVCIHIYIIGVATGGGHGWAHAHFNLEFFSIFAPPPPPGNPGNDRGGMGDYPRGLCGLLDKMFILHKNKYLSRL